MAEGLRLNFALLQAKMPSLKQGTKMSGRGAQVGAE
jgi:hypothetical protein